MTVERIAASVGPLFASGATTTFPFTSMQVASAEELLVLLNDTSVDPSLYSVTLNDDGTGAIVFPQAPIGTIFILSDPLFSQETNFEDQGPFYQSSVNEPIDRSAIRDIWLRDNVLRAIRLPLGEQIPALPSAAARAGRVLGFDPVTGLPILAPGSVAQLAADLTSILARLGILEFGASVTPFNAAAVATDWSSMQNLARAIQQRAFTSTPIKFAGVGSSNMKNAGGGLAGANNSPVEVALRSAKAMLDPFGFCVWEFRNFGVNGSSYSGYPAAGLDDNPDPRSPRVKLLEYDPDVTIVCYGTNDFSPESWNSGQTRNYIPGGVNLIASDALSIDSDVIFMTVPSAKVSKVAPVRINQTIPVNYPATSWSLGQGVFIDFKVTFTAANRRITSNIGAVFTNAAYGFGMAVGKIITVTDPNLGPVTNGGQYRISAIDPSGNWIEVDNTMVLGSDGFTFVPGPAASFTNAGPISVSIKRIAIDFVTEQVPNINNGDKLIAPLDDGRFVRILTRFYDGNQVQREAVATLDIPAAGIDIEAVYNVKLVQYGTLVGGEYRYGEDRYYAALEVVHWNNVLVAEIMEPTFMAFFRALGPVPKTISNRGAPRYLRSLLVRPNAGTSDTFALLDPNAKRRKIDVMIPNAERAVFRSEDRMVKFEIDTSGQAGNMIRRLQDAAGGYRLYRRFTSSAYNIGASGAPANVQVTLPSAGYLTGEVRGWHNGIADTIYDVKAQYEPTAPNAKWDVRATVRNSLKGPNGNDPTLTFTTSGATLIITPNAAGEAIDVDLEFKATVSTALPTIDA